MKKVRILTLAIAVMAVSALYAQRGGFRGGGGFYVGGGGFRGGVEVGGFNRGGYAVRPYGGVATIPYGYGGYGPRCGYVGYWHQWRCW